MRWLPPPITIRDEQGVDVRPIAMLRSLPWLIPSSRTPPIPRESWLMCGVYTFALIVWPVGCLAWSISHIVLESMGKLEYQATGLLFEISLLSGMALFVFSFIFWHRRWRTDGAQRSAKLLALRDVCPSCGANLPPAIPGGDACSKCIRCKTVWYVKPTASPQDF